MTDGMGLWEARGYGYMEEFTMSHIGVQRPWCQLKFNSQVIRSGEKVQNVGLLVYKYTFVPLKFEYITFPLKQCFAKQGNFCCEAVCPSTASIPLFVVCLCVSLLVTGDLVTVHSCFPSQLVPSLQLILVSLLYLSP